MLKVLKPTRDRHRRRSEYRRMDLGKPLLSKRFPDIEALCGERLAARAQPAVDLQGVDVAIVCTLSDKLEPVEQLANAPLKISRICGEFG